jgi:diacylglycerol kinase family enzyme
MGKNLFIVNPGASGGQGEIAWNRFREMWPDTIHPEDVRFTDGPGHATEIAASADGYDILTTIGGDGSRSHPNRWRGQRTGICTIRLSLSKHGVLWCS